MSSPVKETLKHKAPKKKLRPNNAKNEGKQEGKQDNKQDSRQDEGDFVDKKTAKEEMSEFLEKLRHYMLQNHLSIRDMVLRIGGELALGHDIDLLQVENKDKYLSREQFSRMFLFILQEHHPRVLLEVERASRGSYRKLSDQTLITYDDVIRYFENFLNSREKQKNKIDIS